ncbi:hypothetical protein [Deinococcus cavernae]|nr:hypothetical protein [Deinococcus cavernae]
MRWVEITIHQVRRGDQLRLNGGLDFTVQYELRLNHPFRAMKSDRRE